MDHIITKVWWRARAAALSILSRYRHTSERVCPDVPDANFEAHLMVYRFMGQFVSGARVLDVGCGTGYGCNHLISQGAVNVSGIDYSAEAIAYARKSFTHPGLSYAQMDAEKLDFPDASFDVVSSSENIEHLHHPESNVAEMRRVLRPGGLLILGTPNKEASSPGMDRSPNPFHLHEFTFVELEDLLRQHFTNVFIFENTIEIEAGRRMKAERRAMGRIGIEAAGKQSVTIGSRIVQLEFLKNEYSFLSLSW